MSAGAGSKAFDARRLEAELVRVYGPDFRNLTIVGPLASFRLADAFAECGLTDPLQRPSSAAYGLWQFAPHGRE